MTTSVTILVVAFACLMAAAFTGMVLHKILPEHHLSADSKDVVKLATGVLATLCALVLGLLIASSKGSFDTQRGEIELLAAKAILLDDILDRYGPETKPARVLFRQVVDLAITRIWHENAPTITAAQAATGSGPWPAFRDGLQALVPANDSQRALQTQALLMANQLAQTRVLLFEQSGTPIPPLFMVILVSWLSIMFLTFGLFAPPNATVVTMLVAAALSVSAAIFLGQELGQPFEGLMQLPSAPLREALAPLPG